MAKKLTCCSSVKSSLGQYCDGSKEAGVNQLVATSLAAGQCADTDCIVVGSGSKLSVSLLLPALVAGLMTIKI